MKYNDIHATVKDVPYILPQLSRAIYDFIVESQPARSLELGFAHGASSCYIAAALDEVDNGRLDTVDLESGKAWQHPSIEQLLRQTGLGARVSVHRETTQYNWFLMKQIAANSDAGRCEPIYDFCFIDGAKNWTIDGCAFFLVDKLLKPGGWILFDDLNWVYRKKVNEGKQFTDGIDVTQMSEDELDKPHLELVYRYLVMQHPDYSNFEVMDDWFAWAQKSSQGDKQVKRYESEEFRAKRATSTG